MVRREKIYMIGQCTVVYLATSRARDVKEGGKKKQKKRPKSIKARGVRRR